MPVLGMLCFQNTEQEVALCTYVWDSDADSELTRLLEQGILHSFMLMSRLMAHVQCCYSLNRSPEQSPSNQLLQAMLHLPSPLAVSNTACQIVHHDFCHRYGLLPSTADVHFYELDTQSASQPTFSCSMYLANSAMFVAEFTALPDYATFEAEVEFD